jgi:hypothetical protein
VLLHLLVNLFEKEKEKADIIALRRTKVEVRRMINQRDGD